MSDKPETITVLDPRGMIHTDIEFIRRHIPKVHWREGMTLEQVAYHQGQHDLLEFIATSVVGRRLDNGPLTPKATKEATGRRKKGIRAGT